MPPYTNRFVFALILSLICPVFHIANAQEASVSSIKTVVIDAGHGGHDPGTVYGQVKEKDINLAVALALGDRIKRGYPGVKVIYTRSTDVFIPLAERSAKANRNKADLFISIHVNSTKGSSSARGTETFVMGVDKSKANLELCRRENSVITLEKDYSTKYNGYDPNDPDSFIFFSLMQNAHFDQSINMAALVQEHFVKEGPITVNRGIKQAPLLVLWQSTMPAVLVELGFLSNAADRRILTDGTARDEMVECIYSAFSEYKKKYDPDEAPLAAAPSAAETAPAPSAAETAPAVSKPAVTQPAASAQTAPKTGTAKPVTKPDKAAPAPSADTVYRIQIFATSKSVDTASLKLGEYGEIDLVRINGLNKCWVGKFKSHSEAAEALKSLRKLYPEAFLIRADADNRIVK